MSSLFTVIPHVDGGEGVPITVENFAERFAARFGGTSCHPSEFVSARNRSRRAQRVLLHFREHGDRFHLLDTVEDGWSAIGPQKSFKSRRFRSWFKNELRHWLQALPPFLLQESAALRVVDNRQDLFLYRLGFLSRENSMAITNEEDDASSVFSCSSVGELRLL
ncbi:hypothetical protein NCS56_00969900 [Fusarium sp. Ph1]|nr:hypothetical protein NCS56_00969900 [Fusarium sp. Ph1]